jgi:hypothetical protein
MSHAIHRVQSFAIVGPYKLKVDFGDGTSRRIDFAPVLKGETYGPLQDLKLFEQVELDRGFTHWSGRTARTSTRPRCMTGRSDRKKLLPPWKTGLPPKQW